MGTNDLGSAFCDGTTPRPGVEPVLQGATAARAITESTSGVKRGMTSRRYTSAIRFHTPICHATRLVLGLCPSDPPCLTTQVNHLRRADTPSRPAIHCMARNAFAAMSSGRSVLAWAQRATRVP
jgi:hypothetical protein